MTLRRRSRRRVERLDVRAYTIPTDAPESDGTLEWDSTTIVVVEVARRRQRRGSATRTRRRPRPKLVAEQLAGVVEGADAMDVARRAPARCARALRNAGQPGIGSMALSAVDCALWDLKARLLGVPLVTSCSARRTTTVPIYGSGGFCSYSLERLREQLGGWARGRASRA